MATKAMSFKLLLVSMMISVASAAVSLYYENKCDETVWLAASPDIGETMPERAPDSIVISYTPDVWSGSIWLRTKCTTNSTGYFSCESGDCRTGEIDCKGGPPPTYPVTELNLGISNNVVTYEVSLNHGWNVPIRIQPNGGKLEDGSGPCPVVDCIANIFNVCPSNLVATNPNGAFVGCYSACDALKDPKYCCSGSSSGPGCQPNEYSDTFKKVCGLAHTYPADNTPPIYKCKDAVRYDITFCPI